MDFQYENTFSTVKNEHIINEQILVVEDDYINRFYIQKIFEKIIIKLNMLKMVYMLKMF